MVDSDDVWEKTIEAVQPLKKEPVLLPPSAPVRLKKKRLIDEVLLPSTPPESYKRSDVLREDPWLMRALKRRTLAPEAALDLHGYTQDQALPRLLAFLENAFQTQKRLVLVITGKGGLTGEGVLRQKVPEWAALHARAWVISIVSARAPHGGQGAFYVRLRRPTLSSQDL